MDTFPFTLERPYQEVPEREAEFGSGEGGIDTARALHASSRLLVLNAKLKLPGIAANQEYSDFESFWDDQSGPVKSFRFKCALPHHFRVETENIGTGDGAETDFALTHKYIDATTVLVYIDDVLQSSGYTLEGNDTAPLIRFSSAPAGAEVVTVTYEYYTPMRFTEVQLPTELLVPGTDLTNQGVVELTISMREKTAGGRLVA